MKKAPLIALGPAVWMLAACQGSTPAAVFSHGEFSLAAEAVDSLRPVRPRLDALDAHLNGFHSYRSEIRSQIQAHHYCAPLNGDVIQCVIFDAAGDGAKIMGVEYIVSEPIYRALPADEKRMRHKHGQELLSGDFIAPDIVFEADDERVIAGGDDRLDAFLTEPRERSDLDESFVPWIVDELERRRFEAPNPFDLPHAARSSF
jgi:hypothetical protein